MEFKLEHFEEFWKIFVVGWSFAPAFWNGFWQPEKQEYQDGERTLGWIIEKVHLPTPTDIMQLFPGMTPEMAEEAYLPHIRTPGVVKDVISEIKGNLWELHSLDDRKKYIKSDILNKVNEIRVADYLNIYRDKKNIASHCLPIIQFLSNEPFTPYSDAWWKAPVHERYAVWSRILYEHFFIKLCKLCNTFDIDLFQLQAEAGVWVWGSEADCKTELSVGKFPLSKKQREEVDKIYDFWEERGKESGYKNYTNIFGEPNPEIPKQDFLRMVKTADFSTMYNTPKIKQRVGYTIYVIAKRIMGKEWGEEVTKKLGTDMRTLSKGIHFDEHYEIKKQFPLNYKRIR